MGLHALRVATLSAFILIAGCATAAPPAASPAPTAPEGLDPDHRLVMIEEISGWPGIEGTFDPRVVTLYADGRVVTSDPARNSILTTTAATLSPRDLDRVWAMVAATRVAQDRSLELPGLYDAETTWIRVDDGTRATTLSIYALGAEGGVGEPDGASMLPDDEIALRRNTVSLRTLLRESAGQAPYTPPALLLWWAPFDAAPSGIEPRVVPWTPPLDLATAGAPVDNPVYARCALVEGAAAAAVAELTRTIPHDVAVEQGGSRYQVAVRPIYPDEVGSVACP